jgi:hypothetical protein
MMQAPQQDVIMQIVGSQGGAVQDPEVARAVERVRIHGGDLSLALADLTGEQAQFGAMSRFLERLVDQTFEALVGKDEIIDRLEEQRRSLLGNVAVALSVGAGIVGTATGLQAAIATIVFLYLIPIGVRAAYEAWKGRQGESGQ